MQIAMATTNTAALQRKCLASNQFHRVPSFRIYVRFSIAIANRTNPSQSNGFTACWYFGKTLSGMQSKIEAAPAARAILKTKEACQIAASIKYPCTTGAREVVFCAEHAATAASR